MSQVFSKFWKCALQVNPNTYAQQYQGQGVAHGLSEDAYNTALVDRCVKNDIQVVGIADHGSVDGVEKLRQALEAAGIVVFPGFEISSTEKVHMVWPIMVERVVADSDEIVRLVRFLGWLSTLSGEREIKKALRKALFKYKLHQEEDLFEKAYGYIRQYY